MKALEACAAVLAAGALLVGCSSEWQEEVRFKVTRIAPEQEIVPGRVAPARVVLELDQEDPGGLVSLKTAGADIDRFPEGTEAGDVVICAVRQVEENNLDGAGARTEVGPCRSA